MQADMMLKKYLRGLHPGLQAAGKETLKLGMGFSNLKVYPQKYTPSNMASYPIPLK